MAPVPDHLLILLIAIALDAYLGAPLLRRRWRWQPLILIDRTASWCDEKLNRPHRSDLDRRIRGILALAACVIAAGLFGQLLDVIGMLDPLMSFIVLLLLTTLIDQRESHNALRQAERALSAGDRDAAAAALGRISDRDPVHLDAHGLARAAIEGRANRFARHGVGPILAYALFGLAGPAVWWVVLIFDRKLGGGDPAHRAFGSAARSIAWLITMIPDRLAGTAILIALPLQGGALSAATRTMVVAPGRLWPAAATAGGLGLALGGPRRYAARVVQAPWLGAGRARAEPTDLARARALFALASVLVAASVAAALIVRLVVLP